MNFTKNIILIACFLIERSSFADRMALNESGNEVGFSKTAVSIEKEIKPSHLKIEFYSNYFSEGIQDNIEKNVRKGCIAIGNALVMKNGPWGFGSFGSYNCYIGSKKISGKDKDSQWRIRFQEDGEVIRVSLMYFDEEVGGFKIPSSPHFFRFLLDAEFTDLIAFTILQELPMSLVIDKTMVGGDPPAFQGRYWRAGISKEFKYSSPVPPEKITFFRLKWDRNNKIWATQVLGYGIRSKVISPIPIKKNRRTLLKGGHVTYEISPDVLTALDSGSLWGQIESGPGSRTADLEVTIADGIRRMNAAMDSGYFKSFQMGNESLVKKLLASSASGYVGLRYGLQVLPVNGALGKLLDKTGLFSLLIEIRGGPVKGLRYYYDKLPEKKISLVDDANQRVEEKLGFARHVLGYSFAFDPGFIVNRLTIDPKVGIWNFNATLPVELSEEGSVLKVGKFGLGNTFSLALEAGLEKVSYWFTLRGWLGFDTGFSLLAKGGKVTSNRFGFDTYFNIGPRFRLLGASVKTALVGFYVFESVTVSNGKRATSESDFISGVSYSAGYAGAGLAISW